jgi:hypothetical protein
MLLDCSDDGVPMVQWIEQFNQPAGVLLQLRKLAREWQQEYEGLTEHNNNRVKAKIAEEEAQEEFDFPDFEG